MAANSKIEWTDHTFNPLSEKRFTTFGFAEIANAIRLEMFKLVAVMAKGDAVGNFKAKFGKVLVGLDMMGAQVATGGTAALLAGVRIACKNVISPLLVFRRAAKLHIALKSAMRVCIMRFSAWCALACNFTNAPLGLFRVRFAEPIRWAIPCLFAHLPARLFTHFASLFHRGKYNIQPLPKGGI